MADKNRYFIQNLENGTLLIDEDVLESIVKNAVREVDGVAGFSSRPSADVISVIGKKNYGRPLKITYDENNNLQVVCNINVQYGQNIVGIANAVQTVIKAALEASANVTVAAMNVNICGIVRK